MSSPPPGARWIALVVLGAGLVAAVTVLAVSYFRNHPHIDLNEHVPPIATQGGVELSSVVSLRHGNNDVYDVVAEVSVLNTADAPVYYIGLPCDAPADVSAQSVLSPPSGPAYAPAATALRAHVMDYRRSLDQIMQFTRDRAGPLYASCDEAGPPVLPPHQPINYTMTAILGVPGQPDVDARTTDIVTTLQIGALPDMIPGRLPAPMKVLSTIEVRAALNSLTNMARPSAAEYDVTSGRFDLLMRDSRIASWVNAQDPTQWRGARLTDSYRAEGGWRLEAFHRAWAVPLVVLGDDSKLTQVRIPTEPRKAPASAVAAMPPAAASASKQDFLYHDLYIGDLTLPSGKVMVGDIVGSDSMLTFDYGLKPGRYQIHVVTSRTVYVSEDWETAAWEELILSTSPVVGWRPAIPVGHSVSELKPGQTFNWGTDGGEAGFASPEAMKVMDTQLALPDFGLYGTMGEREEANDWLWGLLTVDTNTGANVFATSTGSDGGFPVLLGVDAAGRPAALLSDFGNMRMTFSGIEL